MSEGSGPRSLEEMRLLATAARCLPGRVLGSARFPDEVAFVVARGRGSKLYELYVSLAHTDEDVARSLEAFEGALASLPRTRSARA